MIYEIQNGILSVSAETFGAQLKSVKSLKTGTEYLWQGDEKYWTGRAYNIFPYVGRNFGGKYVYDGKTYSLRTHGVARFYDFELFCKTDDSMTFLLRSNGETKAEFPFDFELYVIYTLKGNSLYCDMRAVNKGKNDMYFALGGHPGFNVPFDGGKFEDYSIKFDSDTATEHLLSESVFISGETRQYKFEKPREIPLKHSLFDNDAIILSDVGTRAEIVSSVTDRKLVFDFDGFKYFAMWHAVKTDAPYVCLEPWSALPATDGTVDDFATKADMFRVSYNGDKTLTWSVSVVE